MIRWLIFFSLVATALALPDYRHRAYSVIQVRGRTFRLEKTLSAKLGLQAARRLEENFQTGLNLLPAHAGPGLRSLKLYIMQGPDAPGGGRDNGLEYFRPGAPNWRQEIDRHWNHCIVCYCAQNYTIQTNLWALKGVLHEQAHAYFLAHYPEKQPEIMAAWEHAQQTGLYRNVTDDEGRLHEQAYALTNQLEYFAELSTMYFARCNYPPFDRAALRKYDPQGYAAIELLWKVR
jgi:hypothetical protein